MKNYKIFFVLIVFSFISLSSYAYNSKDLNWHVQALVNSLITGDDLDEQFVKWHLDISCNEQDVKDTQEQKLDSVYSNVCNSRIIQSLVEIDPAVKKFHELHSILGGIYVKSDPEEKAACIIVEREVSRLLFSMCCMSLKDRIGEKDI